MDRPYVLVNCAVSVDGYLDDTSDTRLVLSGPEDLDRVDELRAGVDAILVGASTVRRDNPRLLVRSGLRRAARVAAGQTASPVKVTLTGTGGLDPQNAFFATGEEVQKLVYVQTAALAPARERVGTVATVVDGGEPLSLTAVLADLRTRGIGRLLVEGGGNVLTQFLVAGLVDELQLAIAPLFVGDPVAPRFVYGGSFPYHADHRMHLAEVRSLGDVVWLRYLLGDTGPGDT